MKVVMDHPWARGAVAALTVGTLVAGAPAARAQGGAARAVRDSMVYLRVLTGTDRSRLDTIQVLMRALERAPVRSDSALRLRNDLEAMIRNLGAVRGRPLMIRGDVRQTLEAQQLRGWIGANVFGPREELVDSTGYFVHYFQYPSILSVEPNSPALRAGLAQGDVLVAYDGQDVVRERVNLSELLVPDRKMTVTVRRGGEMKDFSVIVAKTPEWIAERRRVELRSALPPEIRARIGQEVELVTAEPARDPNFSPRLRVTMMPEGVFSPARPFGNMLVIGRNAIFGAHLLTITDSDFARIANLEKGVYVENCPEDTPAYQAGLRTGDMIVSVAGRPVRTADEVQTRVMMSMASQRRAVTLDVLRDKKPVTITVK